MAQPTNITLVIHGGAGTIPRHTMTPGKEKAYTDVLKQSLEAGYAVLNGAGTSLDAVEAAIRVLEDSPLFNAGKGAVFTHDGKNELDASIMDGQTLKAGAVAGVRSIKNPITLARQVMEGSEYVLLIGDGAETFAREQGTEFMNSAYFFTQERWNQLQDAIRDEKVSLDHSGQAHTDARTREPSASEEKKFGTVGCVALDQHGNLAAGTSTGGMTNKHYSRVGDTPIIGAGVYADNATCAVSATGHGEYFIRSVVSYDIAALMAYKGYSVEQAAGEVVLTKLVQRGGEGGVIAVDRQGNIAMPFNSEGMYRGFIKADGIPQVEIYK